MIIVYHHNNKVDSIFDHQLQKEILVEENHILKTLMHLATLYNDRILVWCRLDCKEQLNHEAVSDGFKLKNTMISYGNGFYLPDAIGYIENSPFVNVNLSVKYPTWQMHSAAGAIYASSLLELKDFKFSNDFDYELNSIAKLGMPKGLFCYSEAKLLLMPIATSEKRAGVFTLFRFVKQHYRTRWVFLLALNFIWHERKSTLLPLLKSLFYKKRHFKDVIPIEVISPKPISKLPSIDVIIPTIGRASYLYDVLRDLKNQTVLPDRVIIVEQNPLKNSVSELYYLETEDWPFIIDHTFTHQIGACNARNIALSKVKSEWVFFADDDIRIENSFILEALSEINNYGAEACVFSCLLPGQVQDYKIAHQTSIFGSGCSFVKACYAKDVMFEKKLEFCFGEDTLYGLDLRNRGIDVIYFPKPSIVHLKAPIGGFRTKITYKWSATTIPPKPSPAIMFVNQKRKTKEQVLGYKTILFFKTFKKIPFIQKLGHISRFNQQWQLSEYWANQL